MAWNGKLRRAAGLGIGLLAMVCSCDSAGGPAGPADSGGPGGIPIDSDGPGEVATDSDGPGETATSIATELAFFAEPGPALAGLYLGPPIRVVARDSAGRTDTRFDRAVTIGLRSMSGAGALLGATRVQAISGIATFPDLRVPESGSGYTLVASAFGLESATSVPFDAAPAGRIAFVSDRSGIPKIHVMNADGSRVEQITFGFEPDSRPSWSPDGRRITFARAGDSSTCGIYVTNADGSGLSRLTTACGDMTPAWSPDGGRIAFAKWTLESLSIGIHVMNADGSGITRLTESLRDEYPDWSPDGRRIAFTRYLDWGDGDWIAQAHVMDADGSNIYQLARTGTAQFAESGPAWSPDGRLIVLWNFGYGISIVDGSESDSPSSVYKGASDLFQIGDVSYGSFPDWSPDGRKIVFARSSGNARKLAVVDAAGGVPLQPLSSEASRWADYEPSWTGVSP